MTDTGEFQDTEIGKIPKEWSITNLESISSAMYYGVTAKAVDKNTGLRMLRTTDIDNYKVNYDSLPYCEITSKVSDIRKYLLRKGDIIVARSGTVGISILVDKDFDDVIFGSYLIKIRPRQNLVYPKFLHYYFQSIQYWKQISKVQGSTLKNINLNILKQLLVPIPPLEEQKKIAEILSIIDRIIDDTANLIDKLRVIREKAIELLVTGSIWHKDFQDTEIGKIPKDWKITTLGEICEIVNGFRFPSILQGKKTGKYPFIKVGDMNKSYKYIDSADNYVDEEDLQKLRAKVFPKGTIIFPKIGMAIKLNKFRILACDAVFDNNIAGLIPKNVNNEFLYYYCIGKIDLISLAKTTTVPSITKNRLSKVLIPLPPLEEQKKIAEILSTIDKKIEVESNYLEALKKLKEKLLSELMTGRIRVNNISIGDIL